MSESVAQIIDDKGGPSAVAAKVGRSPGAVRVWKHRDSFPRDAWPEIIGAYPDITLDRLMRIERGDEPVTPAESAADEVSAEIPCKDLVGLTSGDATEAA